VEFIWVFARLIVAIWMLSTGLAGFGSVTLAYWSRFARLLCAAGVLYPDLMVQLAAVGVAVLLHFYELRKDRIRSIKQGGE